MRAEHRSWLTRTWNMKVGLLAWPPPPMPAPMPRAVTRCDSFEMAELLHAQQRAAEGLVSTCAEAHVARLERWEKFGEQCGVEAEHWAQRGRQRASLGARGASAEGRELTA